MGSRRRSNRNRVRPCLQCSVEALMLHSWVSSVPSALPLSRSPYAPGGGSGQRRHGRLGTDAFLATSSSATIAQRPTPTSTDDSTEPLIHEPSTTPCRGQRRCPQCQRIRWATGPWRQCRWMIAHWRRWTTTPHSTTTVKRRARTSQRSRLHDDLSERVIPSSTMLAHRAALNMGNKAQRPPGQNEAYRPSPLKRGYVLVINVKHWRSGCAYRHTD